VKGKYSQRNNGTNEVETNGQKGRDQTLEFSKETGENRKRITGKRPNRTARRYTKLRERKTQIAKENLENIPYQ